MILKVNPTRISLLNLKRELKVAGRGHKLLKDKRDGLMKKFMSSVREVKSLRERVEREMGEVFRLYVRGSSAMPETSIAGAFLLPNIVLNIFAKSETVMSVPTPNFSVSKKGRLFSYGFSETGADMDTSVLKLDSALLEIVKLAELEKTLENLAIEIEKTRRRASALENTKIPNLKDTIRFITMRLEEQARDAVVATMRVKAQILATENS
ncbi:MAG: V-type ATP synthase subunit D [bacterium]|nr:V-type ATP synthase subunit D [bacterium]